MEGVGNPDDFTFLFRAAHHPCAEPLSKFTLVCQLPIIWFRADFYRQMFFVTPNPTESMH